MTLAAAMKKLQVAARRLEDGQGRIARRNARRAVAQAQRAVRAVVDREFPPVPRGVSEKAPPRATKDQIRKRAVKRAQARDLVPAGPAELEAAGRAGIKPSSIAGKLWVPLWLAEVAFRVTDAQLRKAARDIKFRKAMMVSLALPKLVDAPPSGVAKFVTTQPLRIQPVSGETLAQAVHHHFGGKL